MKMYVIEASMIGFQEWHPQALKELKVGKTMEMRTRMFHLLQATEFDFDSVREQIRAKEGEVGCGICAGEITRGKRNLKT